MTHCFVIAIQILYIEYKIDIILFKFSTQDFDQLLLVLNFYQFL